MDTGRVQEPAQVNHLVVINTLRRLEPPCHRCIRPQCIYTAAARFSYSIYLVHRWMVCRRIIMCKQRYDPEMLQEEELTHQVTNFFSV